MKWGYKGRAGEGIVGLHGGARGRRRGYKGRAWASEVGVTRGGASEEGATRGAEAGEVGLTPRVSGGRLQVDDAFGLIQSIALTVLENETWEWFGLYHPGDRWVVASQGKMGCRIPDGV